MKEIKICYSFSHTLKFQANNVEQATKMLLGMSRDDLLKLAKDKFQIEWVEEPVDVKLKD